ncbi:MAG TPA: hypothetical protein VKX17_11355 [Planctomycetota bacterium]|nr:hypothetical protein [Planctomycetota bacterium]
MRQAMTCGMLALVVLLAGAIRAADEIKTPDWVPAFPEAKPEVIEKVESVTLHFTTPKSVDEVTDFYKKAFIKAGFAEAKMQTQHVDDKEEGVRQENLKTDDGKRAWFFSARSDKVLKETHVSIVYTTRS